MFGAVQGYATCSSWLDFGGGQEFDADRRIFCHCRMWATLDCTRGELYGYGSCIECHWVMAEVCSLRMCLLWFTEYFHGFYGHIGWDAGNLSIPYWGNSEKLQPYQELFFNLEMVNSGPFYAVFFKVHWPFNVTLIGSIFKSCKFWSCLQFFTSCELYNTNFYLEVMWINVAEFEHGLSRLIIDKQTETADPCRRIYCLTSVWCWEITQLKDKGEENKFNIILFISMFVFE